MRPYLAVIAIVAAVLLAGCMQQNGDEPTPTDGNDGADEPVNPTVTLLEPTGTIQVTAGQEFTVRWSVDPELSGEHDIPHVGVHWGPDSVNAGATTGPGAYGNNAGVQAPATIPGDFTTTVTIPDEGTYYLRAHAIADGGANFWSDAEATIEVEASSGGNDTGGDGEMHTVQIGTQMSCAVADYNPPSLTITSGDSVQWENVDSCPHTADPEGMTGTGNIDPDETSDPIVFNEPGTYAITCGYHPQMSGEVIVEEA